MSWNAVQFARQVLGSNVYGQGEFSAEFVLVQ